MSSTATLRHNRPGARWIWLWRYPRTAPAFRRSRCDGSIRYRTGSWQVMQLRGECDSPQKRQSSAEAKNAQRGHTFWRKPFEMARLQDRRVKKPERNRSYHLDAG